MARKRFWQVARVVPAPCGFAVQLDDRPLQTPAKAALVVPRAGFAAAIAAEWDALGPEIRPEALPLTRAANSAIDRVGPARPAVGAAVAAYGETDLLYYRAEGPAALTARQAAAWDPLLDWAERALGARLRVVSGLMPQPQPEASLAALRDAVEGFDAFALTALHDLVTISGSLVLGLAVAAQAVDGARAFALAQLDEDWQAGQWGWDAEAAAAAQRRREDFLRAETMLALLRPGTRGPEPEAGHG